MRPRTWVSLGALSITVLTLARVEVPDDLGTWAQGPLEGQVVLTLSTLEDGVLAGTRSGLYRLESGSTHRDLGVDGPVHALMTDAQVPAQIVELTSSVSTNPYVLLMLVMAVLLVIGVVMDLTPAMIILAPILTPVVVAVGVPPVYFGVLMSLVLGIGLITPPVGTCLYVGCAVGKVTMEELLARMWPFYLALLAVLALLVAAPGIVTWLPDVAP